MPPDGSDQPRQKPSKRELRERVKRALAAAPAPDRAAWSARICDAVAGLPAFRTARTVMLYAPMLGAGEVDVAPLAAAAAASGKRLAVPRPEWTGPRSMAAVEVANLDADLVPDPGGAKLGLRRPREGAPEVPVGEIDLVVVPGLAFDPRGNRLGRGVGHYDRFLTDPGLSAATVGVCFAVQLVPEVPTEPHDVPVHTVVTERGVSG